MTDHKCPKFISSKVIGYYDHTDTSSSRYLGPPDAEDGWYLLDCDCGSLEDKISNCPFCGVKLD